MKYKNFKNFISVFVLSIFLLSFFIPNINNIEYLAATIIQTQGITETTKEPKGFKIENAEYWDYNENYDKSRIWIDQGGGGSGRGGGAGGDSAQEGGNGGTGNEKGGILGNAAGVGMGSGNEQGIGGEGGGMTGSGSGAGRGSGSTGSAIADALRALKEEIAESRAESIARELESAFNASEAMESIAKRESEQESIQKKLTQEKIKSYVVKETVPKETQKVYEMIPGIEQQVQNTQRKIPVVETNVLAPTSEYQETQYTDKPKVGIVFNRETTEHIVDAVEIIKAQVDSNRMIETVIAPTSNEFDNTIVPEEFEMQPEPYITGFTPAESIAAESQAEMMETTTIAPSVEESTVEKSDNEDEGKGSKGGEDAEADEDKKGDDGSDESQGNAAESGQYHKEDVGEYAGKKIFELDQNGNIGLEPEHMSNISTRTLIMVLSTLLFVVGAVVYFFGTRDKKSKKNYF